MLLNSRPQHHQTSAHPKHFRRSSLIACVLYSLSGISVYSLPSVAHATDSLTSKSNLYTEKYVKQNERELKSLNRSPDTLLIMGNNQAKDNTSMLEKGYDMMGSSTFVSTKLPAELAREHGKKIQADTVLVYARGVPIKTKIVRFDHAQEAAKVADESNRDLSENPQIIHYASYWAKLPTPLFGVHVIKLIPVENQSLAKTEEIKGLTIIAVINESPAEKAGILKGDHLLKIGELEVKNPDDLFTAVNHYAGQTTAVELQRDNETVKVNVALNAKK